MALLRHAETLKAAAANAQALSEAAVLLRAWAHQQQLAAGADAMPGFLLTMLLVHLIESGQAVRHCLLLLPCCRCHCTVHDKE